MINLPKVVMALCGKSAVLDITEKIHNWSRDKEKKQEELGTAASRNDPVL